MAISPTSLVNKDVRIGHSYLVRIHYYAPSDDVYGTINTVTGKRSKISRPTLLAAIQDGIAYVVED